MTHARWKAAQRKDYRCQIMLISKVSLSMHYGRLWTCQSGVRKNGEPYVTTHIQKEIKWGGCGFFEYRINSDIRSYLRKFLKFQWLGPRPYDKKETSRFVVWCGYINWLLANEWRCWSWRVRSWSEALTIFEAEILPVDEMILPRSAERNEIYFFSIANPQKSTLAGYSTMRVSGAMKWLTYWRIRGKSSHTSNQHRRV